MKNINKILIIIIIILLILLISILIFIYKLFININELTKVIKLIRKNNLLIKKIL